MPVSAENGAAKLYDRRTTNSEAWGWFASAESANTFDSKGQQASTTSVKLSRCKTEAQDSEGVDYVAHVNARYPTYAVAISGRSLIAPICRRPLLSEIRLYRSIAPEGRYTFTSNFRTGFIRRDLDQPDERCRMNGWWNFFFLRWTQ